MNATALPPPSHKEPPGGCTSSARRHAVLGSVAFFLALTILLSPAFASAAEEEAGISPVVSAQENSAPARNYIVWPLVYVDETVEWRQSSFIPFYVEREAADDSEKRVQFLWPIFLYRRSERDVSVRVVPFFTYWKDVYAYTDGEEYDTEYMLFPFIYGSDSSEEGRSFALFPIGGKLRNFLGRDEIGFFLFPLYLEYRKGELYQRNYLWPILSFSEGGGSKGFRLWPLYGYSERPGEYRSEFALWPIYSRQKFDLDKEQAGERVLIFPIYAREDSRAKHYRSVLWPFFGYERNFAGNFEERSAPWPFIVITRGDVYGTRLWPLYGFRKTEDSQTRFLLWPFWRKSEYAIDEELKIHETLLVPFWSSRSEIYGSGEIRVHRTRFWPLWRFRRFEDGSTRLRVLSLLWFNDERGFERQYSPLWTIYERETAPGGAGRASAFWGLYRRNSGGGRSEARVPFLFSRTIDSERDLEETKIFGGLLATTKRDGKRRLRLFHFSNHERGENKR